MIALTALVWCGVLLQLYLSLDSAIAHGTGVVAGLVSYFGYFTIVTNLLVCISLTTPLIAPASSPGRFFARSDVTAGVATSIVFVGLAYHVLLRNVWNPQGLNLIANDLLHYITPIFFLAY